MQPVIAIRGQPSEKMVDGKLQTVVPFVGADSEGELAQMGIGILLNQESEEEVKYRMHGVLMPHDLISSWRGMKLLEQVDRIEHGTICACCTLANRHVSENEQHAFDLLAPPFGGLEGIKEARAKVLTLTPTAQEIELMINSFLERDVDVDSWDLITEVNKGTIALSSPIKKLVEEENARRRFACARQRDTLKLQAQSKESLSSFFRDLQIGHFIVGDFGRYDLDWYHIKRKELDDVVRTNSNSCGLMDDSFILRHTAQESKAYLQGTDRSVANSKELLLEAKHPQFTAFDGRKFTFMSAKFRDNRFFVRTKIETSGSPSDEVDFTILELREMVGPIKAPSSFALLFRRLFRKVYSFFKK